MQNHFEAVKIVAETFLQQLNYLIKVVKFPQFRGCLAHSDITGKNFLLLPGALPDPLKFGKLVIAELAHAKEHYQQHDAGYGQGEQV